MSRPQKYQIKGNEIKTNKAIMNIQDFEKKYHSGIPRITKILGAELGLAGATISVIAKKLGLRLIGRGGNKNKLESDRASKIGKKGAKIWQQICLKKRIDTEIGKIDKLIYEKENEEIRIKQEKKTLINHKKELLIKKDNVLKAMEEAKKIVIEKTDAEKIKDLQKEIEDLRLRLEIKEKREELF